MRIFVFTALAFALITMRTSQAALVISEVLYNEIGSSVTGEWVEIFNNGSSSLDLSNYKIGDEETSGASSNTEGMFRFPTGAVIAAGEVQLIAIDADVFLTNYGFLPTYEVSGVNATIPNLTIYATWDPDATPPNVINFANANDQALILDDNDNVVDAVSWGNTFAFDPALDPNAESDGQSYERINGLVDTDTAADWQLGNLSSPGTVAVPEPGACLSLAFLSAALVLRRRREA